ncbi:unnamed protein product, partial [Ectocarpus fasciculatus]
IQVGSTYKTSSDNNIAPSLTSSPTALCRNAGNVHVKHTVPALSVRPTL